jgi:putative holliday junction resolvase
MATAETVLAFDYGAKRTGVAVGNSITLAARPLTTIAAERAADRLAAVRALVREWQPQRLVVGAPAQVDGSANHATHGANKFARSLRQAFGLPVESVDETLSSAEALARGAPDVDAEAAAIILQRYFDRDSS